VAVSERGADHAPTRLGSALAVGAAGLAAVTGTGGSGGWVMLAPAGAVVVTGGLWRGDRRLVTAGCGALLCAALVTGLSGGAPARTVLAVAATMVAWDIGEHAVTLGDQLGRRANTWRLELLHAAVAVAVATGGVSVVSLSFLLGGGGHPLVALVALLVGSVALLTAIRSR
jgi:hypothetical protein